MAKFFLLKFRKKAGFGLASESEFGAMKLGRRSFVKLKQMLIFLI